MNTLGYIALFCALHFQVYGHNEDESIILHSLKKRDLSEQIGPIPLRQREDTPQAISEASRGGGTQEYDLTAVLNPNIEESDQHDPQSSIAGGARPSYVDRNPGYRQYLPTGTQGDAQAPTYDYRQSSSSQSHSSQGRTYGYNQPRDTPTYSSEPSFDVQPSNTQGSGGAQNNPVENNEGVQPDSSQGSAGSSRSRSTQTDTRYTGYSGATATYSPTGTRRHDPSRTSSGRATGYYSQNIGSTGPTGRQRTIAASYPLGPIVSTGGGQPQYTNRQQTYSGGQVYRQTPGYRTTYAAGGQGVYTGGSQPTYTAGRQPVYSSGQPTYTAVRQRTYPEVRQPTYTAGGQPYYTGSNQYSYSGSQQPVYNAGGQSYVPYGYYPQEQYPYYANNGNCPDTGIRMRINGMDCARAIEFYGPFLCYRHESTSRECCETCRPLKNRNKVGCEYGDHSYQCRQIQAHDCYDLRNRQSCCETCDRLRNANEAGCEYGDMTPRCERIGQNPSLCYIPENQRLCCSTCRRLRGEGENQVCPWGDQNSNLCRPFDQYGGVRINCYAEPIRRLCCQTCERLRSRMPGNLVGCEYGDRPVIFNTGEFGSLNCTSFFRHFPVQQCQLNQAVAINCCYTCHRYQGGGRQRQPTRRQGQDNAGSG